MTQKNKVLKYYIEFRLIVDADGYATPEVIESKWFEIKEEALKWYHMSFNYVDDRLISAQLMTAEFNDEGKYVIINWEDVPELLKMSLNN